MRKTFNTMFSATVQRLLLMLVFLTTGLGIASAAVEWKPFEFGTRYDHPFIKDAYYTFTAQSDGIAKIYLQEGVADAYTSGNENGGVGTSISTFNQASFTDTDGTYYDRYYTFSVKKDSTYYLVVQGVFSEGEYFKGVLETNTKMELLSTSHEVGKVFDITDTRYGQLTLTFNMPADADAWAYLKAPNYPADKEDGKIETRTSPNTGTLIFNLKDTLSSWIDKGIIKGGEEMTLTVTGIHSAADKSIVYGTDGSYVFKFLAPGKPHQLVSNTMPNPFLSYWPKGDTRGIAVLNFDYDVMPMDSTQTATAQLLIGYAEQSDVYTETIDPSCIIVDGKQLKIDLTGKLRTYEAMGLKTKYTSMRLSVKNVQMADGSNAYSSGKGTSGSFTFNIPFEEYKSNVVADFTPADGEQLTDNFIKIYLSDKKALTFGGVKFEYQTQDDKKYQEVVKEGITSEEQGENAIEYTVPISDAVKNGKNVRVSLTDQVSVDGMEHNITAKFNPGPELLSDLDPVTVNPADKAIVASFNKMTLLFDTDVTINADNASGRVAKMVDTTTGKDVDVTIALNDKNAKQVEITPAKALEDTHSYEVSIANGVICNSEYVQTAGKYGRYMLANTYSFTLSKSIDNYDFLATPLPGSTVKTLSTIQCVTKPGADNSTSAIVYGNDANRHVWIKNEQGDSLAQATVKSIDNGIEITFEPAITEAGNYTVVINDSVYYVGEGFNALPNEYKVEIPYTVIGEAQTTLKPATVTPADESTVESLKTITLTFDEDVYGETKVLTLYNMAARKQYDATLKFNDADRRTVTIELENELTDAGGYLLEIPTNTWGDKTWFDSGFLSGKTNPALTYSFDIGGEADNDVTTDPAAGTKVDQLKKIVITWTKADEAGTAAGKAWIEDASGNKVAENDLWWGDEFNQLVFACPTAITADGTYTLVIPAGSVIVDSEENTTEYRFTWTIGNGAATGINGVVAEGAKADVYTVNGVRVKANATQDDLKKLTKGVYIVNGKKIVVR